MRYIQTKQQEKKTNVEKKTPVELIAKGISETRGIIYK